MDRTQRGVLVGMASAFLAAVAIFVLVVIFAGPGFVSRASLDFRVELLAASVMAPALSLFVCIARLANHRFFTPADINGSALTDGTARAKLLQALLQNTLEQAALAVPVYLSFSFVCTARFLGIIPAAAACFLPGALRFLQATQTAHRHAVRVRLHVLPNRDSGVRHGLFPDHARDILRSARPVASCGGPLSAIHGLKALGLLPGRT
jgi:hypothetical protein